MVEELKLAIKIDDATIEQSLLKQFANAQKMADKVVLDFKNVNFDDKQIEAKFKEMQKKAGQNPIDLTIGGNTLDMLGQIDKRLTEVFSIGKGKSFIDSSSITSDIGKIENKINELNKKYEESQKKLSFIGSGGIFGEESIRIFEKLLTRIESSLSSIKGILVDVGDGEELSPLLKTIANVESGINKLSSSVKGIGLNMNIDFGSDTEIEAKVQAKISNALQAYQRLFDHIKSLSAGGSLITQKFFDFDINQFDTPMSKLQAYKKFIENMRNEAKSQFNGKDILYSKTDKKYWSQASSAMGQVTKAFNEMKASTNTNPLENIFGKTDLTEVIEQLNTIVSKLDEISVSAKGFTETLKNGLNINASVEEIEKLTNRVKELESELAKIKTPTTIPSKNMKDAFPKTSENLEQVAKSEQKVQQEAVATDKALDNISFTPNTEGFDDIIAKFGILREQAEQITKIVKTTKQTADGMSNISYKATLRNGSSYYLGENSIPQVLNASETVYDAKADNAKKLEREKQIWNELTTSLERYATIQKRVASNNALSTDNEEVTKLLEHIHELQRNDILPAEKLTASNEKLQQINQTVTDLKAKLKESTLDSLQGSIDKYQKIYDQRSTYSSDFTPSEQYTKNLIGLNTAIGDLVEYRNALKNVGEVTVEQEAYLKGLVTACEKASASFKSLSASEKGASQIGIDKLVQRINKDLDENTNYSKRAKLGLRALRDELESANPRNLKEITSEIINIENAEIRAGRAGKSFFDIFKTKGMYSFVGQMQSYLSMYVGFYGMVNAVKSAVSTIVQLDDALVDLKKTTAMNENQLENFYYDSNNVAKQMGVTTKEIIDQASAWSRLGYNTAEASTEMAKLSSQFASISPGMEVDEAQSGLVSIMKAWSIDPDQVKSEIMDPINQLGNTMAEDNQDIVEGMERSAAALAAVGTSTKDAFSLFSGIQEVLQNSEKSGTALRSVALRLRSFDEETQEYSSDLSNITGELADLTKTAEHAKGVSIFKPGSTTEFKSLTDYFREISDIWDEMSQKQQNDFLLKAFGRTQAQAGAALIQNFKGVDKALQEVEQSSGSADKEMSTVESSLTYKINALKETWVGCVQDMIDRGDLGTIVTGLTKLSEGIGFVIDKLGILGSIGLGAGIFAGIKNVGEWNYISKFHSNNIICFIV
jgi:TP901 family phage tail tape measure protein|nr:MAG TPA: minor tail protein [Caudoviricetes sp.]